MNVRPLRGRRHVDQLVILAIPTAIAAALGIGAYAFYVQRMELKTEAHVRERESIAVPTRMAYGLTPRDLDGTYQGEVTRKDKQSSWVVLRILQTTSTDDDRVIFQYELNARKHRQNGVGDASLSGRWIRFAGMQGQIVLNGRGVLTLRSMPRDALPRWTLEAGGMRPDKRSAE